ncbi:hypothetical protein Aperf_G00000085885 [Anoplocephala perfoliata]
MHSVKPNKLTPLKCKSDSNIEYFKASSSIVENEGGLNPKSLIYYPWWSKLFRNINEAPSEDSFVDAFNGVRGSHFKKILLRGQQGESSVSESLKLTEAGTVFNKTPSNESSMTISPCIATETNTEPCIPEYVAANLIIQTGLGRTLQNASMLSSGRSSEKALQSATISNDSIIFTNNSNRGIFHRLFGRVPRATSEDTAKGGNNDLQLQQNAGAPKNASERPLQRIAEPTVKITDPKLNMLKNLADSIIDAEIQAARIKKRRIDTQSIGNQTEFISDRQKYSSSHLDSGDACNEKLVSESKSPKKSESIQENVKDVSKVRVCSPRYDSCQTAPPISRELPTTKKSFSMISHQSESIPSSIDEGLSQVPGEQHNMGTFGCIVPNRQATDLSEHSCQYASFICSTLESRSPTLKFPNRIMILNAIQDLGPKASNLTPKTLVYELVSVRSEEMGNRIKKRNLLFSPRTSQSAVPTSIESNSLSKLENRVKNTHDLLSCTEYTEAGTNETNDMEKTILNVDLYLDETTCYSKQNELFLKPEGNVLSVSMDGCTTSEPESIPMAQSLQRKALLLMPKKEGEEDTLKSSSTFKAVTRSRSSRSIEDNQMKSLKMACTSESEILDNKAQVLMQNTICTIKEHEVSKSMKTRAQSCTSELQNVTIAPKDTLSSASSSSIQALGVEIKANPAWLCQGMCIRTHEACEECRAYFDESLRTDVNIKFSPTSLISCEHIGGKPVVTIKIDPKGQNEGTKLGCSGPISVKLGKSNFPKNTLSQSVEST